MKYTKCDHTIRTRYYRQGAVNSDTGICSLCGWDSYNEEKPLTMEQYIDTLENECGRVLSMWKDFADNEQCDLKKLDAYAETIELLNRIKE